jgi:peptidoglycan hydrolase CwlO-like protein
VVRTDGHPPVVRGLLDALIRRPDSVSMLASNRHRLVPRGLIAAGAVAALLASNLIPASRGDLQGQIDASRSAAASLQSQIAADTARIQQTAGGLHAAEQQLAGLQGELQTREAQLRNVQNNLLAARDRLVWLENRLQQASNALASNLRANYEGGQPDLMTVILESHGFADLLERVSFLQRIGNQDAHVVGFTRTARAAVARQATALAVLENRDRSLTEQVLGQRNQVAALQAALLNQQISQESARTTATSKLNGLNARLKSLEARAAAQAAAAASTGNAGVGGIAVNTGGMVQPPSGAPAAVAQVIAAGNAIATLPYIWGGGHGSFHASGYDCSGSVSYALAAAGLLSSPLDSTGFESWGEPGPGRWITVYANAGHAFMVVAGWRFDTVALAESGTRWSQTMVSTAGYVARHPPGL